MDMRKEYVPASRTSAEIKSLMDDLESYYQSGYITEEYLVYRNDIEKFKLAAPTYELYDNGIITADELNKRIAKILSGNIPSED